jgi:predicted nucleotidyltransferase
MADSSEIGPADSEPGRARPAGNLPTSAAMRAADAAALRLLRERVGEPVALYRFGSSADGALRPDSDLDYAVLARRPLGAVERFDLQADIARAIRRSVDLVDLRQASAVMRMQVIGSGVAVAVGDAAERERFEIFAYASYARLNEERRAILDQIADELTVYGG